jgi:membrane fusion protein, multidrug efflux system
LANTVEEQETSEPQTSADAGSGNAPERPREETHKGHPVRNAIIIIVVLLIFLAIGIIPKVLTNSANDAAAKQAGSTQMKVQTVHAQHSPKTATLDLPGDIEAIRQSAVVARATGYLKQYFVDIGDHVTQGQVMATIETPDEDQDLLQARAAVAASQAAQSQAEANLIGQIGNLDQAHANLSRAAAALAQAQQQTDQQKADVAQAQQAVAQDNANLIQAEANRDLAKITATRYQNLVNEKAIAQQVADQEAVAYQTAQANVQALQAAVGAGKANVSAIQAGVQAAQSNVTAYKDALYAAKSAVDTAAANVTAYRESVTASNANLQSSDEALTRQVVETGYQNVTAPFSGIVTARNVDNGDLINAGASSSGTQGTGSSNAGTSSSGTAASGGLTGSSSLGGTSSSSSTSSSGGSTGSLFSIAQLNRVRIYVNIPQSDVGSIHDGILAHVEVRELPSKKFTGVITRTADALDPVSRTLVAEVDLSNPGQILRPGMFAELEFDVPQADNTLIIPDSTLVTVGNGTQVATVINKNTVHFADIQVGRDFGQTMQVLGGISPKDSIIDNPPDGLREGQKVSASPEKVKKPG